MTREEVQLQYKTEGDLIVSPGKFEKCPLWVPAYWDMVLSGLEDFVDDFDGGEDETIWYGFHLDASDVEMWPELKEVKTIRLRENAEGFVVFEKDPHAS